MKTRAKRASPGGEIVQAIERELRVQGRSKYWLAKQCGIQPSKIYAMLERDFGIRHAAAMIRALKLRLVRE